MRRRTDNNQNMFKRMPRGHALQRADNRARKVRRAPAEQRPKTSPAAQIDYAVRARHARPTDNDVKNKTDNLVFRDVGDADRRDAHSRNGDNRKQRIAPNRVRARARTERRKHYGEERARYKHGNRATVELAAHRARPARRGQNMAKRADRKDDCRHKKKNRIASEGGACVNQRTRQ